MRQTGGLYEVLILQHLASIGFPYRTPRLMPTCSGEVMVPAAPGQQWVLYPVIEGATLRPVKSVDMSRQIGCLAGAFSAAVVDFELPASDGDFGLNLFASREEPAGDWAQRLRHENSRSILDRAFALCSDRQDLMKAAVLERQRQVVYYDFHDRNMLEQDGKLVGLIDFDSLAMAPRLVDFQNALTYLLAEPSHRTVAHVTAFSDGFRSAAPLLPKDHLLIAAVMVDRLLWMIGRIMAEQPLRRHRRELAVRFLDLVDWIVTDEQWLADTLASA
ncbi:MAG TPA: phosphotransferase [Sphingomicrobium sp.]